MTLRQFTARVAGLLATGSATAAGLPLVIADAHAKFTAVYGDAGGSWVEDYHSFLTGGESIILLTLLQPLTILLAVTFVHAVWQRSLTVVTLFATVAVMSPGVSITLPPFLTPLATRLCPMCAGSSFGVEVTIDGVVVAAALLCNLSELLRRETRHTRSKPSEIDDQTTCSFLATGRKSGRILSNLSGYTLVVLFLVIGITSYLSVGVFSGIGEITAGGLAACALVFYEFVATNAGFSLAALSALTWHAGLAALQYDTALSEFLLATATLLTISAVGFLYSNWRAFAQKGLTA